MWHDFKRYGTNISGQEWSMHGLPKFLEGQIFVQNMAMSKCTMNVSCGQLNECIMWTTE